MCSVGVACVRTLLQPLSVRCALIPAQSHRSGTLRQTLFPIVVTCENSIFLLRLTRPSSPHFHSAPADFKQPVAEPATSFNSGIPRSLEHHLIIPLTIPATPTVPPFLHNGI